MLWFEYGYLIWYCEILCLVCLICKVKFNSWSDIYIVVNLKCIKVMSLFKCVWYGLIINLIIKIMIYFKFNGMLLYCVFFFKFDFFIKYNYIGCFSDFLV